MSSLNRIAAVPALVAAFSMFATPASAADLRVSTSRSAVAADMAWDASEDEVYQRHRRYRDYRYRNHRIDAGDVLAGVVILGGIAAIANAVKRSERDERYRYREDRYRYRDSRYRSEDAGGIDRAVSNCVSRIERDVRVDTVDAIERRGEGWLVSGSLYNGEAFTCSIDRNWRVDGVDFFDGRAGADDDADRYEARDDRQWDDTRYQAAWADLGDEADRPTPAPVRDGAAPAYPGGPVDGDLDEDEIGTGYPGAD